MRSSSRRCVVRSNNKVDILFIRFKLPQPPIADIIMETFAKTAARPNPLGSGHVRIFIDVASRWRLALDIAGLASVTRFRVKIFFLCMSPASVTV